MKSLWSPDPTLEVYKFLTGIVISATHADTLITKKYVDEWVKPQF